MLYRHICDDFLSLIVVFYFIFSSKHFFTSLFNISSHFITLFDLLPSQSHLAVLPFLNNFTGIMLCCHEGRHSTSSYNYSTILIDAFPGVERKTLKKCFLDSIYTSLSRRLTHQGVMKYLDLVST